MLFLTTPITASGRVLPPPASVLLDLDAEIELWFSGLGKVRFEFDAKFDVKSFSRFLGNYIL